MKRLLFATTTLLLALSLNLSASAHDPEKIGDMTGMGDMSKTAQKTTMLPSTNLMSGQPQKFTIQVRSANGKPVNNFQIQHEKLMHLILVNSDLTSFQHVHPTYLGKGTFQVTATLPADGTYTAFVDYVPKGSTQKVEIATLKVGKAVAETILPVPDSTLSKTFGDLDISLLLDPKTVRPNQEVPITFEMKDASGKPITDLQPYLGAMGHLVIIKVAPVLTAANYLHAHPEDHDHGSGMNMSGMGSQPMDMSKMPTMGNKDSKPMDMSKMPAMGGKDGKMPAMSGMGGMSGMAMKPVPGQVTFETQFPGSGTYRLWGQFQRAGKVFTADFTISI